MPVRENARVIQGYWANTWSPGASEMGTAFAIEIMREGKGIGERNIQFRGLFKTPGEAYRWLAEWADAGFPDEREEAMDQS